jgi:endo-1,4-beta-xylanase
MTGRASTWRRFTAIVLLVGLIAPLSTIAAPRAQAADTVVSSVNFNDSTTGTWTQSGGPTLSYVDDGNGGQALSILRAADYEGIQSPAGILEAGVQYAFSMRARLPDGVAGTADVRFVVKPNYNWVGNTTIDASGWATVSGTYTLPDGVDPAQSQIYIGSTDQTDPYTILIDDILITRPAPPPSVTTISSVNFNDSTTGTWTQSGGPTLGYVDDGNGGLALSILRAADYEGIQSPTGLLQAGVTYTFSMRAKLPDGVAGTTDIRFVVKPNYNWVANTTISADAWTTISGTYSLPDGVDPSEVQIYIGSTDQTDPYTILIDDILITAPLVAPPSVTVIDTDFESGLDGWTARDSQGTPTVALTEDESHSPTHAALVSDRTGQGDGIGHDVTGLMESGTTYDITAWVKFAAGNPTDSIWLSMRRTNGGSDSYDTIAQFTGISGDTWTEVHATYSMGPAESAFMYFETTYPDGTTAPFLVDDIKVASQGGPVIDPNLTPLKSTVSFPVGVAIAPSETSGVYADLVKQQFNQITAENAMKPDGWYDASHNFRMSVDTRALMDFAAANNIRVYGHTLVWHQQTPDWFFQHDDGTPLTNSPADQDILRTRLHDHIYNIAQTLSDQYGLFGSATNPLVAFDVVNEVVSDGTTESDGLRRSAWYNVLGPEYIDDAFNYANDAFNSMYAEPGVTRPIKLAINDYNTEQSGKRQRLHDLVANLLSRGIPVDIVGNQFHLNLTTPTQSVDDAITAFEDLPVMQDVSELDVPTGTPVTDAKLIDQGYFYRDLFRIFRNHASSLFSVTVWGLYDGRSWRSSSGAPLLFNDQLQAKPAFIGAIDGQLAARQRAALVFEGSVALDGSATTSLEWAKLPLHTFGDNDAFQLRWESDHMTAFVSASDATVDATDAITFKLGTGTYTLNRDGTGTVPGVVSEVTGGWKAVVSLPLTDAQANDQLSFDVSVTDGTTTSGWNDPGAMGTLTLVEPLSYTEIAPTPTAPHIDGAEDPVWALANSVSTDKQISGTDTAKASVKLLWQGNTLYVYAHVVDPVLDDTSSDPWQQDSVEIYVDAGNAKNGTYRPEDTQIRINYNNVTSFGTGDEAAQQARLTSATQIVDDGYVVEAAIDLLGQGGSNTFQGLDFQVNDGQNGARIGITNWADPTGLGYQSTAHWGVGRLLPDTTVPTLQLTSPYNLTATAKDGFHGLTAEIAGVTATDAFDPPSALTITNDAPDVLKIGLNVVTWTVTDPSGNTSSAKQVIFVHARIQTWVAYIGSPVVTVTRAGSFPLGAILVSRYPSCVASQPVSFSLDRNPVTGEAGSFQLGAATTNRFGLVLLRPSTDGWQAGKYFLTVSYAGNSYGCLPSSSSVKVTVVVPPKPHRNFDLWDFGWFGFPGRWIF